MFSGKRMEESAPTLNLADVRRIIEPLYEGQKLFTGESVMAHAEGVVDILRGIRDDDDLLAAAYLFCVWNQLKNPKEWLAKHFGKQVCELVANLKVVIDVSEKPTPVRERLASVSSLTPYAVCCLLCVPTFAWYCCVWLRVFRRCVTLQQPKLRVQKNTVPRLWRFTLRLPTA